MKKNLFYSHIRKKSLEISTFLVSYFYSCYSLFE